jgi:hypothetical protein
MPLGPRTSDGYQLYSYMTMELGGPSMYWLGTSGTYKKDPALFVKHATSMLQVCWGSLRQTTCYACTTSCMDLQCGCVKHVPMCFARTHQPGMNRP